MKSKLVLLPFLAMGMAMPAEAASFYARTILPGVKPAAQPSTPTPPPPPKEWETGAWSGYSSQCSTTAVRTRSVQCVSGGKVLADNECASVKPEASEQAEIYTGCTYEAGYSAFSACANHVQTKTMNSCTRSDGASVDLANCSSQPQTVSQPCYTYTSYYSQFSSCTNGQQTKTMNSCIRDDNVPVALSYCDKDPASISQACQTTHCDPLVINKKVRYGTQVKNAIVGYNALEAANAWCNEMATAGQNQQCYYFLNGVTLYQGGVIEGTSSPYYATQCH